MKNKRQNVESFKELHSIVAVGVETKWKNAAKRWKTCRTSLHNATFCTLPFIADNGAKRDWEKQLHLRNIENTNKTQKDMPLPKIIWNVFWLFNKLYSIHKSLWIVVIIVSRLTSNRSPPSAAVGIRALKSVWHGVHRVHRSYSARRMMGR